MAHLEWQLLLSLEVLAVLSTANVDFKHGVKSNCESGHIHINQSEDESFDRLLTRKAVVEVYPEDHEREEARPE